MPRAKVDKAGSESPTKAGAQEPRASSRADSRAPSVAPSIAPSLKASEAEAEDDDVEELDRKFSDFTLTDELQASIGVTDIKKLNDAGYRTIGIIFATHSKFLEEVKGLSDAKVAKIKDAATRFLYPDNMQFRTGNQRLEERKNVLRLSTGSSNFDAMLGGGFQTSSVCEVYGEFRCGKTQLCHTMSVVAQLPTSVGGGEGKVAYIDTENTFRPERIRDIAERFGIDQDLANDNIIHVRVVNSQHQHEIIFGLIEQLTTGDFRIVIIDSIMAKFRVDYNGRGELSERQQFLGRHLALLAMVAQEFNVLVLMTNHVQSDPGAMSFAGADGRKPVGGHILAHASTTRVLVRKGRGEERVAKLQDSPDVAEGEAIYVITHGGIQDVANAK